MTARRTGCANAQCSYPSCDCNVPLPAPAGSPFDKRAADRMAAIVDEMIYAGHLDARSQLADARLDYGQPFTDAAQRKALIDPSERTAIAPPTDDEIAAYRDLFRRELDKRMDLNHPSGSPSTESHAIALRAFVASRNKAAK